jgi:polyphenol oxidase
MISSQIIVPDIFTGFPVKAFFTKRGFQSSTSEIIAGLGAESLYLPIQKHTDKVIIVEENLQPQVADAVVTNRRGLAVGIQVADCVPIILVDKRKHVAAVVHAGWRGTAAGILRKTIDVFRECFHCSTEDIVLAVGPSIKGGCYAVGPEVADAVTGATGRGDYVAQHGRECFVDLPEANRLQAVSEGILPGNIWVCEDCTHCLPEKYHSYRYSKGTTGRQHGYVVII